mgnify:CR=1 FL=1
MFNLISDARKNKDVIHLKNVFIPCFDWNDAIYFISNYFNSDYSGNKQHSDRFLNRYDGKKTNVFVWNNLDLCLYNFNDEKIFKDIYNFTNNINILKETIFSRALINLAGHEQKYYIHKDLKDNISFQQLGKMEWRIYGNVEGADEQPLNLNNDLSHLPYKSYILEPGDVLFIPKGVAHEVVVNEPRFSILLNICD